MTQITDTLRDSKRLRLIATALELMQYERTDSAVIPIPGTEPQRYVAVGSAETVARLLEIAPTAQEVTQQAANAETAEQAAVLEEIAQSWDGCKYDSVGETLDIGEVLRDQFKKLATTASTVSATSKTQSAPITTPAIGASHSDTLAAANAAGQMPVAQVRTDIERCDVVWFGSKPPHGTNLFADRAPAADAAGQRCYGATRADQQCPCATCEADRAPATSAAALKGARDE